MLGFMVIPWIFALKTLLLLVGFVSRSSLMAKFEARSWSLGPSQPNMHARLTKAELYINLHRKEYR